MSEPSEEADWIVNRVAGIVVIGTLGGYGGDEGKRADAYTDRVKDALAAAIELHDVLDGTPLNGDVPKWLLANERLHTALSALRGEQR